MQTANVNLRTGANLHTGSINNKNIAIITFVLCVNCTVNLRNLTTVYIVQGIKIIFSCIIKINRSIAANAKIIPFYNSILSILSNIHF